MEQHVFPHPAVSRTLREKFIEARLHTDHPALGDRWAGIESKLIGYSGQSIYVVVDAAQPDRVLRMTSYKPEYKGDPKLFVEWLEGRAKPD